MLSDLAWIGKLMIVSLSLAVAIKTLGSQYPLPETPTMIISLLLLPTMLILLVLGLRQLLKPDNP
ncbi:hypothetical protein [Synechococcus sp. PCC 6312]|uniref:hypothetical protein n=1 Tax=Synechococcus sp. (strain ATCC 27167 / PCC 6312) TaxID=195253 RepID=UPI00029EF58E|nr:hypothetical protein [Synechococcus sp. PCC 6312]AFY62657.1 hypothetical protein Syn6312_3641 [Synechococcus sp. PCC 6312]